MLTRTSKFIFLHGFFVVVVFCLNGLLFLQISSMSKYGQFKIYHNILNFWAIQKLNILRPVKFHLIKVNI